jgi:multiple antibiotic resistance protein
MTDTWADLTHFAIGLFALLNPFTTLPYVMGVASPGGGRAILTMALSATATMIAVLLAMHIAGEAVLIALGTSLPSFQVGGGLVILLTGLSMLRDAPATDPAALAALAGKGKGHYIRLGVTPLGIPMLAGAGSITKVILETQPHYGLDDAVLLGAVIVAVCLLSGVIIAASAVLMRLLGAAFFAILARLAGLVIVAVGVEVMSQGVMTHARTFAGG